MGTAGWERTGSVGDAVSASVLLTEDVEQQVQGEGADGGHGDAAVGDGLHPVRQVGEELGAYHRGHAHADAHGQGRREAKSLNAGLAVIYANESMRLTSRLLEIASWLLLRRSVLVV